MLRNPAFFSIHPKISIHLRQVSSECRRSVVLFGVINVSERRYSKQQQCNKTGHKNTKNMLKKKINDGHKTVKLDFRIGAQQNVESERIIEQMCRYPAFHKIARQATTTKTCSVDSFSAQYTITYLPTCRYTQLLYVTNSMNVVGCFVLFDKYHQ